METEGVKVAKNISSQKMDSRREKVDSRRTSYGKKYMIRYLGIVGG